jgi:uroporphyrin-III C-methyltransferase
MFGGLSPRARRGAIGNAMSTPYDLPSDLSSPDFPPGLVWLAGAGPGDPSLLTLQALSALRAADVVVYDALVDERLLDWRRPGAVAEYAGKRGGRPSPTQRSITLRLIELARAGKRVLRLKGGDPFVFGRGGEEAQALVRAGIPIRVTPGISAGIGGLAYAGIPVTHRDVNQAVTFITGHDQSGAAPSALDWGAIARGSPVLVLYMAMKHLRLIAGRLIEGGRDPDDPVAIAAEATLPGMRVLETTLARAADDAEASGIGAPAVICIGRVVSLRRALDWMGQLRGEPPRDLDPLGVFEALDRDVS